MSRCYPKPLLLLLLTVCACASAFGGGVRSMRIPTVSYMTRTVVVDGDLNEWRGIESLSYVPYRASLETDSNPIVRQLQTHPSSAKVAMAYDADALYVSIEWVGSRPVNNTAQFDAQGASTWWQTGDGVELHILADHTTVHVASWPKDGQAMTVLRVGNSGAWAPAANSGTTSALVMEPAEHRYTEEIRIPWSVLTRNQKVPTDRSLQVACDLVWADLDPDTMQQMPEALHRQSHFTSFFLTAVPTQLERNYLSNPNDWGDLVFGTDAMAPRIEKSPTYTALTSWTISRARKAPIIDGEIKEWAGPFATAEVLPGLIGSRYDTRLSMQYDADYLYVAAHFKTSGPLQNVMTEASEQGFRGGDALQIRLSNRSGKTVNLCGWMDADGKPALTSDAGDLANQFLLQQGAKEAFSADADGMGYTQEIAIPWQLIFPEQASPKAGDRWKATFQPWWSGLDPRFTFSGEATLAKRGAIEVSYELPADGEVSLGIYDGSKLLNTLLKSEFRDKGENTENWDGFDHWGEPVAPGDYQVKGIYHPRIMTEHVMSFGNLGNPPWPTADNKGDWLSDEATPQAAVTDGNWVFLAAPGSEKGYAIIAVDETGQRVWGTKESFYPRTVSLALEGNYLYALFSGPERTDSNRKYYPGDSHVRNRAILICLDKRTGKAAKFTQETPRLKIATWPYSGVTTGLWELRTDMSFSPDNYAGQPRYFAEDIGEATSAIGIAALDNKLYVAMREQNQILVLNADTGAQLDEISVDKPAGLHAVSSNELLAISGNQVVKINTDSQQSVPVIEGGLFAPRCVTTDANNQIYVSDWGRSFQVKVFAPDGTLLRSIGKEGGRPWMGEWDTSGMLVPTGIAVTDAGKLWVAEDDSSPKRISVWNAETGAFLEEFVGPTPYGGGGALIDPIDPTVAYSQGLRLKLDTEAQTWEIESSVGRRMDINQPFAYQGHATFANRKLVRRDGQEYLIQYGKANITIFQRKGDLYLPVAAQGGFRIDLVKNASQKHLWDSDIGYHIVDDWYPAFFKEHLGENYTWTDLNGDYLVQPEEMQWVKALSTGDAYVASEQMIAMGFWGGSVGDDWSIYWPGSCLDAKGVYRLDVKGWTDAGAPIYDIEDSETIAVRKDSFYSLYATSDGNVFINYAWERNQSGSIIECIDREGNSLWEIPFSKEHGIKDIHSNNILNEFTIPGLGTIYGTWAWHGNYMPHLITADGLYVSSLLESGQRVGPHAAWDESFKAYYQDPDGVPYIINGANDAHHLLEIKGLEGGRFDASLQLTADDVARAAQIAELPVERMAPEPIIMVGSSAQPPVIDGELDEWNLRSGVSLTGDKERSARIALQRDDKNLYLAYEVHKDSPFSNQGNDWQALFISGDCVDLMLANNRRADPHRPAPVEGDQRLLITQYQGEPIAVLYRPVVPGTTDPIQLMAARIDEIKRLDSADIRINSEGNRYTVEVSVPLDELRLDPKESDSLQGDVGVIFSDETGSSRSQRLYYYNQKTGITADLTTEATLQPAEWGTIQFPLGTNLLKSSGFNGGFADKPEDGWFPNVEKNGGRVWIRADDPRSGVLTLRLEQTEPVIYPPESYNFPDHRDFVAAGNNGTGGGRAGVTQTVPVTAGKYYSLRVNFRAEGLKPEIKKPDPKRGYSQFVVDLNWQRPGYTNADKKSYLRSIMTKEDSHEWNQITNLRFNHYGVPTPYLAPEGATAVTISLRLETNAADNLPTVWVDDVELVEVEVMDQQSPSAPQK